MRMSAVRFRAVASRISASYTEAPFLSPERFTTTIDGDLLQKIKILAIYQKCSSNDRMEEAIKDLLKKYEDKKAKVKKDPGHR